MQATSQPTKPPPTTTTRGRPEPPGAAGGGDAAQRGAQPGAQAGAVVERAQHVPPAARSRRAGDAELARAQAGRGHQAVEAHRVAVGQGQLARAEVRRRDGHAEPEGHVRDRRAPPERDPLVQRGEVVRVGSRRGLRVGELVREELLRQRRPVVRHVRLGPDDGDGAGVPGRAQLLGGAQPAEAGAGDGDVLGHIARSTSMRVVCQGLPTVYGASRHVAQGAWVNGWRRAASRCARRSP